VENSLRKRLRTVVGLHAAAAAAEDDDDDDDKPFSYYLTI
jgi:hypothetical protein